MAVGCYQWHNTGSGVQAGGGRSGVHVVEKEVDLPQWDASTAVTDLWSSGGYLVAVAPTVNSGFKVLVQVVKIHKL